MKNYKDSDKMLADADFVLECSTYESTHLWLDNNKDCNWASERSGGWLITIGKVMEHPVCISIEMAVINNKNVLIFECTSDLVYHTMIEKFFKGKGHSKIYLAENFRHLISDTLK